MFKFEGGRTLETLAAFAREVRVVWQGIAGNADARSLASRTTSSLQGTRCRRLRASSNAQCCTSQTSPSAPA